MFIYVNSFNPPVMLELEMFSNSDRSLAEICLGHRTHFFHSIL